MSFSLMWSSPSSHSPLTNSIARFKVSSFHISDNKENITPLLCFALGHQRYEVLRASVGYITMTKFTYCLHKIRFVHLRRIIRFSENGDPSGNKFSHKMENVNAFRFYQVMPFLFRVAYYFGSFVTYIKIECVVMRCHDCRFGVLPHFFAPLY